MSGGMEDSYTMYSEVFNVVEEAIGQKSVSDVANIAYNTWCNLIELRDSNPSLTRHQHALIESSICDLSELCFSVNKD